MSGSIEGASESSLPQQWRGWAVVPGGILHRGIHSPEIAEPKHMWFGWVICGLLVEPFFVLDPKKQSPMFGDPNWGPLILIPGGFSPSMVKWCSMHTIQLGILFTANGACLPLVLNMPDPTTNLPRPRRRLRCYECQAFGVATAGLCIILGIWEASIVKWCAYDATCIHKPTQQPQRQVPAAKAHALRRCRLFRSRAIWRAIGQVLCELRGILPWPPYKTKSASVHSQACSSGYVVSSFWFVSYKHINDNYINLM